MVLHVSNYDLHAIYIAIMLMFLITSVVSRMKSLELAALISLKRPSCGEFKIFERILTNEFFSLEDKTMQTC